MVWKVGCVTALIGIVATVGSCAFFGTAVNRALERRQVYDRSIAPGTASSIEVSVDPESLFEIRLELALALSEQLRTAERESGEIVSGEVPVAFSIRDETGEEIAYGAGRANGTVIVPADSHPSRRAFQEQIDCVFTSEKIEPSQSGDVLIMVDLPATDDAGSEVLSARLLVFDQITGTAGRWALSGLVSMLIGPAIATIGLVVFVIGLLMRMGSSRSPGSKA